MLCWFLLFIKLTALTLTEKSLQQREGSGDRSALRGPWLVRPVTSRSRGLRGGCGRLFLLFLTDVRPVHVSLDLQGIGWIYDLL